MSLFKFLCLALLTTGVQAQRGPIDPAWVYTTPLNWKHAPAGIDESFTFAKVVVLYPEGEFLEISAGLIRRDKDRLVTVSNGDGLLLSTGTWSRTDEQVVRIHSREVMWSTENVSKHICHQTPAGIHCDFEEPHPEPFTTETCALEHRSPTHLAATIHCKSLTLHPVRLNLDPASLQQLAAEAFRAAALQ
jgi:hypothetical protein